MVFDKQKAFGQHFLKDQKIIQAIVEATIESQARSSGLSVLEIGPGNGAITRPLLQALPLETPFHLAERDRELIAYWEPESRIHTFLKGDFLDQPDELIETLGPLVVVSNLPYSAGTAIVVRLAKRTHQISEMILMFQAEVAKRLYAKASTPDRGSLTLFIQNHWDVEPYLVVPQAAFNPPPKVMSEVVRLKRRASPFISCRDASEEAEWERLLKLSFQHRRKMLRGNLSDPYWKEALKNSGVPETARAESLEWSDWIKLWNARPRSNL